ncbi:MAG: hypothetical protein U9P79_01420 [Candidatus Cloacimonadota bacterium]|nr:hypothetical protein [Candidatus Cloacimonadota bacterium]
METKELFTKVKQDVGNILSKAAHKTEIVARLSKLKLDIASYHGKIKATYKKMGEYIYTNKDQFGDDEFLADLIEKIGEFEKVIEKTEASIAEIKKAEKEAHQSPKKTKDNPKKEEETGAE